jgi:hypothetical protein
MKKFFIFMVLIILLGAAGFFLGWTQLTVPPGSYGVMRSKTHGLENQIIRDGEFRWLWYKLIPTNAEISVYTIDQVKRAINNSGSLSSGEVYAALAGLEADFSWEISGEFSFSLKPEALPGFTATENVIDNSGLKAAEEKLAAKIEYKVLDRLRVFAESDDEKKFEYLLLSGSLPDLNREIEGYFPEIESFNCVIKTVKYPDFALYQSVKELYRDYLGRQNAALSTDVTKEAERRIATRLRLDELSQYGELLTKYPILLDYLALEQGFTKKTE